MEEWRIIKNFPHYAVSSLGIVKRVFPGMGNRSKKLIVLSPIRNNHGYVSVPLYHDGKRKFCLIHHLVAEAFIGERPSGDFVHHKDGKGDNNSVTNLEYVTPGKNQKYCYQMKGREPTKLNGGQNPMAKLTEQRVLEIRRLHSEGMKQIRIATLTGIPWSTVSQICRRVTWKHI